MKLSSAVTLSLASSAAAFAPQQHSSFKVLQMSESPSTEEPMEPMMTTAEEPTVEAASPVIDEAPAAPLMSQSLPWMESSPALDGSMVGDVGFDPLGFAKTKDELLQYREAEIKHGRLAMLAAAGWPISELMDKKLANTFGLDPLVDASDRAPSLLNGGLGKVSPVYWFACLLAASAIDLYGIKQSKDNAPDYFPGNLGFDPLGLYPKTEAEQLDMQLKELKNGRLAMIAITAFAVQEFVQKIGVIDETPIFFKPISVVIKEYANSGYIMPDNL